MKNDKKLQKIKIKDDEYINNRKNILKEKINEFYQSHEEYSYALTETKTSKKTMINISNTTESYKGLNSIIKFVTPENPKLINSKIKLPVLKLNKINSIHNIEKNLTTNDNEFSFRNSININITNNPIINNYNYNVIKNEYNAKNLNENYQSSPRVSQLQRSSVKHKPLIEDFHEELQLKDLNNKKIYFRTPKKIKSVYKESQSHIKRLQTIKKEKGLNLEQYQTKIVNIFYAND